MRTGSFETDTQRAGKALQKFEKDAAAVGKAVGVALVAATAAIVGIAKSSINSLDSLNDLSDATGSTVENLSALERIAKLNGQTLDDVGGIVVKFNAALKNIDGKNGASRALQAIGLDAKELQKLDPAEALRQTAVALSGFADDGNKARIVQELFGKSVKEAGPFLKDLAEAGKLNATVTTEQAKAAEQFNKEIFALQTNISEAARTIVAEMLPALNSFLTKIRDPAFTDGIFNFILGKPSEAEAALNRAADVQKEIGKTTASIAHFQAQIDKGNKDPYLSKAIDGMRGRLVDLQKESKVAEANVTTLARALNKPPATSGTKATEDRGFKPEIGPLPGKPPKTPKGPKAKDEFTPLLKQATEMQAAAKLTLEAEEDLTEAQKLGAKIAADFAAGLVKLTEAQVEQLDAALKTADATQKAVDAKKRDLEQQKESRAANAAFLEQQSLIRDSYLADAKDARDAAKAFGLTRAELEKLSIARINDAAAALERKAAVAEDDGFLSDVARLYRQQAAALRDTAKARGELAEKERAQTYDPLVGQTQAVKDYLAEINKAGRDTYNLTRGALEGLEDALTTAFTGGDAKGAFKSLIDSILKEATRLYVVKPLLNSIFGGSGSGGVDYAKLLSSFGSLFGGTAAPSSTGPAYVYPGSYATGMQTVPRDGYAFLHKDEQVVPKAYSAGNKARTSVVIENHGQQVQQRSETGPDGEERMRFIIKAASDNAVATVAGQVNRNSGAVPRAIKARGLSLSGAIPRRA